MQARFAQETGLQRTQNGALQEPPPLFFGDSPNKTLLFDGAVNYDWHAA